MNAEHTHGHVDLDEVRMHYVEAGAGPLVVLYHGFPSCWVSFKNQLTDLSSEFRVVAVDGLGANLSSKPADLTMYRVEQLAEQLDTFTHRLAGDAPFALVGHDWGAALGWAYAQAHPDRLHALVAMSAPPYNQLIRLLQASADQRERSSYMWSMRYGAEHRHITSDGGRRLWEYIHAPLRPLQHFDDAMDEELRAAFAQPGAIDAGINWYRANIPEVDSLDGFGAWPSARASTSVPTLQIWGDDDETFVPGFLDDLSHYAEDLTVLRLPGTRHWPMIERREQVSQAICDFVTRSITST